MAYPECLRVASFWGADDGQISRQFGRFLRRADRFYADLRVGPDGLNLERGAYLLLSRIATDGSAPLCVKLS
jgi:hypothetical protein